MLFSMKPTCARFHCEYRGTNMRFVVYIHGSWFILVWYWYTERRVKFIGCNFFFIAVHFLRHFTEFSFQIIYVYLMLMDGQYDLWHTFDYRPCDNILYDGGVKHMLSLLILFWVHFFLYYCIIFKMVDPNGKKIRKFNSGIISKYRLRSVSRLFPIETAYTYLEFYLISHNHRIFLIIFRW